MSPADKAAAITGLTQAAFDLALAGVRARHPNATPEEERRCLAEILHGPAVAQKLFPTPTGPV
jgi:hypothetical protein